MKVKQVYVADDGQEFSKEEDCLNYENAVIRADQYKKISTLWNLSEDSAALFVQNNYEKIKAIMEPVQDVTKQPKVEVEWSTVPEGSMIFVRDYEGCGWNEREFVRYNKNDEYDMPFICRNVCRNVDDDCSTVNWKFGKFIPS